VEARESEKPNLEELLKRLRARVEERRKSGLYPPELEEELVKHFKRIVADQRKEVLTPSRGALAAVRETMHFDSRRIPLKSKRPGGKVLHRLVGRLVARQTEGVLDQVSDFAQAVYAGLASAFATVEDPSRAIYADLTGRIDAILERLAAVERPPEDVLIALRELRLRVEALEKAQSARQGR
jgi:hypothetical protein